MNQTTMNHGDGAADLESAGMVLVRRTVYVYDGPDVRAAMVTPRFSRLYGTFTATDAVVRTLAAAPLAPDLAAHLAYGVVAVMREASRSAAALMRDMGVAAAAFLPPDSWPDDPLAAPCSWVAVSRHAAVSPVPLEGLRGRTAAVLEYAPALFRDAGGWHGVRPHFDPAMVADRRRAVEG